jgi:hypothetical protein
MTHRTNHRTHAHLPHPRAKPFEPRDANRRPHHRHVDANQRYHARGVVPQPHHLVFFIYPAIPHTVEARHEEALRAEIMQRGAASHQREGVPCWESEEATRALLAMRTLTNPQPLLMCSQAVELLRHEQLAPDIGVGDVEQGEA